MINTEQFGEKLLTLGYRQFSGVPCSYLKSLINFAENRGCYLSAANEGDAAAICAGSYLGGSKAVLLCQNSGLTNALSPITSLTEPYHIPLLMFIGMRGDPREKDEPQHQVIGKHTCALLDKMGIKWEYLSHDFENACQQLERAENYISKKISFAFLIRKNTFNPCELEKSKLQNNHGLSRESILKTLQTHANKQTALLSTTGYTSRELFSLSDNPNQFYMVGSMGCVNSIGLGLAHARKDLKTIVIDGDGALLMRLGSLATIARQQPNNLLHIVLANGLHESTGGQSLAGDKIDFAGIASLLGYTRTHHIETLDALNEQLESWLKKPELCLLQINIRAGVETELSRPTIQPHEVATRFKNFIRDQHDDIDRLHV